MWLKKCDLDCHRFLSGRLVPVYLPAKVCFCAFADNEMSLLFGIVDNETIMNFIFNEKNAIRCCFYGKNT